MNFLKGISSALLLQFQWTALMRTKRWLQMQVHPPLYRSLFASRALSTSISLVRVAPSNQPPVFPLYSNLPASIQSMAAAPLEGETSLTHHAPPAASGHSAAFYWKSERAVPLFDHQGDADVRAHSSLVQSPESLTVAKRSLMASPAARAISNVILSMALDIYYQKQIVETKEIYFHNTSIS